MISPILLDSQFFFSHVDRYVKLVGRTLVVFLVVRVFSQGADAARL
jgi:hypothetical protein